MSQSKQNILNYGDDVQDLDCSPFEHLRMLHDRTEIENIIDKIDTTEKRTLIMYDLILLDNADKVFKQINKIYDFTLSEVNNILTNQWWGISIKS